MPDDRPSRFAVLIDADNTSPRIAAGLFDEIAKFGEASVRRIYGDFSSSRLQSWTKILQKHAIDPYQQFVEYNDPTLSLSIAQNLPTLHMFPAKLQAIVDARNLFEQSFGTQRTQIAQYPRLVKGGINIKF